jgi:IclR family transcriptional regulator, KDG regulon repressor
MGLTRSNMHRTLQTLASAGYVRTAADGSRYECTLKLFELSSAIMERIDVRRCARRPIMRLAERTRLTVHLAVLDDSEVVYLDKFEGSQPVARYSTIGGRAPAHCVASGKALLAWMAPAGLKLVTDGGLQAWTDHTITDSDELQHDLDRVRATGCAMNRGEWRVSVGGVAAIILDAAARPAAAVGVSGPLADVVSNEQILRAEALAAAQEISRELGCLTYPYAVGAAPGN